VKKNKNSPKYNIFKNSKYAVEGLLIAFKTESSLRVEVFLFVVTLLLIWYLELCLADSFIIIVASLLVILSELFNSAIETVVDMITMEYDILAKKAKDIGSGAVFISITIYILSWIYVLGSR